MSSKQRKEKSYSIHGMQSTLNDFINRRQYAIKLPRQPIGRALVICSDVLYGSSIVRKKKIYIYNGKFIRYKTASLFQTKAGYNQWWPRLHHKRHTVQATPSTHTVQAIPSTHTSNSLNTYGTINSFNKLSASDSLRKKMAGALEENGWCAGRESG